MKEQQKQRKSIKTTTQVPSQPESNKNTMKVLSKLTILITASVVLSAASVEGRLVS
jgi:hypothetical protein